jgi:hypothetical protein
MRLTRQAADVRAASCPLCGHVYAAHTWSPGEPIGDCIYCGGRCRRRPVATAWGPLPARARAASEEPPASAARGFI